MRALTGECVCRSHSSSGPWAAWRRGQESIRVIVCGSCQAHCTACNGGEAAHTAGKPGLHAAPGRKQRTPSLPRAPPGPCTPRHARGRLPRPKQRNPSGNTCYDDENISLGPNILTSILQVAHIFWHRAKSPTDEKNSSSVMACRRAALSPCRLGPAWWACSGTGWGATGGLRLSRRLSTLSGMAAGEPGAAAAPLCGSCGRRPTREAAEAALAGAGQCVRRRVARGIAA